MKINTAVQANLENVTDSQQIVSYPYNKFIQFDMIGARVNAPEDFSEQIKQFVIGKSSERSSAFTPQYQEIEGNIQRKAKRSLTDWRQLYQQPSKVTTQNRHYFPKTAQCRRASLGTQLTKRAKSQTADGIRIRRSTGNPLIWRGHS